MTGLAADFTIARRSFEVALQLAAEPGERIALFGPSGAGKTTIVEVLAGLTPTTTGRVRLGDATISLPPAPHRSGRPAAGGLGFGWAGSVRPSPRRRSQRARPPLPPPSSAAVGRVAVVRQPTALFPHLDIAANVSYGRSEPTLAATAIEDFGLGDLRHARPAELSGGQAQRVALARALARRAELLLLDEPMSAIDQAARRDLWAAVQRRIAADGATAVLVTHDLAEAQSFGDRLVLLDSGQILQDGDPHEVVAHPVSERAARVAGYDVFLQVSWTDRQSKTIAVRWEDVRIDEPAVEAHSPGATVLRVDGIVRSVAPSGAGYAVTLALEAGCAVEIAPVWEGTTRKACLVSARANQRPVVGSKSSVTALHPCILASETG